MIREGVALVTGALRRHRPGPYQLQAAIAAIHAQAPSHEETDWVQVVSSYRALERMSANPVVTVIVLRNLDERLAARLTERTGVPIAIVDYASFEPGEGPLAILNTDALSRGGTVADYVPAIGSYAASLPVASTSGETIALLEARLPVEQVMAPASSMTRNIIIVPALIAVVAIATQARLAVFAGHGRATDS
jgi:hypothetical protein